MFLSAGEPSGDRHAAAVARALRERVPSVSFLGLGGPHMAEAGVELLAGLEDLAVMGFLEVARRIAFFHDLRRRVYRTLRDRDIRLVIPLDYPGFNLPLSVYAHRREIPVLYYIAPQVWAWKERRARTLASACDRVLTVLPFEDPLLHRYGVDSQFVGHPLLDEDPVDRTRATARDEGAGLIGIFPGSRAQEVERILPVFVETAHRLSRLRPDLSFEIARTPHVDEALYSGFDLPLSSARDLMSRACAALTKSGTITLELALAGVPMVVGYRTGRVTYAVAKRLVRVPSIALVNLVAGRNVVPEFVQDRLEPDAVSASLLPMIDDGEPVREQVLAGLTEAVAALGTPGCAGRVADHAAELLG